MAVFVRRGVVAFEAAFESGDVVGPDAEVFGGAGQGDVFGLPGGAQVGVVVDRAGCGEVFEHLASDGAFEQTQDVFFGAAGDELAGDVVAGARIVGHPDQGDTVQRVVGGAVPAAREPMPGGLPGGSRDGAAPLSMANAASERSRWLLVPAVMSSWAAVSGPTP